MYGVISGALMMGCLIPSIFFYKFWKKTHDKLFLMFSAAFAMLAIERLVLGNLGTAETHLKVYLIRLFAFLLILVAIIIKNREPHSKS